MDELKVYDCPQCGGHYTPSPDNEPTECDYCGIYLQVIEAEPDSEAEPNSVESLGNVVLREYINTVLPKITEMTAYFPELTGQSFDGQFFKGCLEEYLQRCDDK